LEDEPSEDPGITPKSPKQRIASWVSDLRSYWKITRGGEIARRYVAMNGFDGLSTSLGVITGLMLGGASDPNVVVSACIGAGAAMCISGLWGAYVAERAERKRKINELEDHMKRDLSGSVLERASTATAIVLSLVDGLAAGIPALVPAVPFVFVSGGGASMSTAFEVAIGMCVLLLFLLGIYVGRVSGENQWVHGILMVATGLATVILLLLLLPRGTAQIA